jgi:Restriction endonuclease
MQGMLLSFKISGEPDTAMKDDSSPRNPLMAALEKFEAAEGNLLKLECLWSEIEGLMPESVSFASNVEYEDSCRSYTVLLAALPKIDGWKPEAEPPDLDGLAQSRFDAMEIDEPSAHAVERWAEEPGRELREYRFRLNTKRRALIREALVGLIDQIDADIRALRTNTGDAEHAQKLGDAEWQDLRMHIDQVEVLLGSSVDKPAGWRDLRRHMHFAHPGELHDIETVDWPQAKQALRKGLYGANEPIPVDVEDLSDLVAAKPRGPITTELAWSNLDDVGFERLIFGLIGDEPGYENPEWLMQTRAPDRGRDLSVTRVVTDSLSGTLRLQVVIQCKHWLSKSVTLQHATSAKDQMTLWMDPRVDVLVIATSGRFTADAVQWIERHNGKGESPRIEMWPESHLQRLLAARPGLIAEFGLRKK